MKIEDLNGTKTLENLQANFRCLENFIEILKNQEDF